MVLQGQDAWRRHPVFRNLWRGAFPGFRWGVIAFTAIWATEIAVGVVSPPKPHIHLQEGLWTRESPSVIPTRTDLVDDDDE